MPIKLCGICRTKDNTLEMVSPESKAEYGNCTMCGKQTMVREMVKIYPDDKIVTTVNKPKEEKLKVSITADDLFKIIDKIANIPDNTDKVFSVAGTGFTDNQCIDFFNHSSVLVITRKGEFYKGGKKIDVK